MRCSSCCREAKTHKLAHAVLFFSDFGQKDRIIYIIYKNFCTTYVYVICVLYIAMAMAAVMECATQKNEQLATALIHTYSACIIRVLYRFCTQ